MAGVQKDLGRAAPADVFDALSIGRRVLLTPHRTISIASIATVSVATWIEPKSPAIQRSAIVCAVFSALTMLGYANTQHTSALVVAVVLAVVGLLLFVVSVLPGRQEHRLIVTTGDGAATAFTAPARATLEQVRRILSDKIDAGDATSTYAIDLATGVVEARASHAEHGPTGAGGADAARLADDHWRGSHAQADHSDRGHVHSDMGHFAHRGAEVQVGVPAPALHLAIGPAAEHVAGGPTEHTDPAPNAGQPQHIHYGSVLPQIEQMMRFYAGQPAAWELRERLSELEVLMRSGTPMPGQRARVRELAVELADIVQPYPQMVQFFQSIAVMVGA